MAVWIPPHDIEPSTTADANEVQGNNLSVAQFINTKLIHRDGAYPMDGPLTLNAGDPIDDRHAANKGYVDSFLPVGSIMLFGGVAAPAGHWLLCDGATYSATQYPELYAVLGAKFATSAPPPAGSFKVPNLRGRVIVGFDGRAVGTADTRFDAVGEYGGTWTVPLPQHLHSMAHNHGSFASGVQSVGHTHTINHDHGQVNTGADGGHSHVGRYFNDAVTTGSSVRMVGYDAAGLHATVTDTEPDHTHTVNLPAFSGSSGSQSASHTHTVDVPNYTGNTANTGTAGAEHLPPYMTLNYIIRAS